MSETGSAWIQKHTRACVFRRFDGNVLQPPHASTSSVNNGGSAEPPPPLYPTLVKKRSPLLWLTLTLKPVGGCVITSSHAVFRHCWMNILKIVILLSKGILKCSLRPLGALLRRRVYQHTQESRPLIPRHSDHVAVLFFFFSYVYVYMLCTINLRSQFKKKSKI